MTRLLIAAAIATAIASPSIAQQIQPKDRPLVPGTDWSKTEQYLRDDRPSVRGYDEKGLPKPQIKQER